jgi:hypothetical protein
MSQVKRLSEEEIAMQTLQAVFAVVFALSAAVGAVAGAA